MMPADSPVIRVSLAWFAAGAVLVLLLGMAGGILAHQLWPPAAPLGNERERIVPTVQQVTISPDTAAASALEEANRAIVHVAVRRGDAWVPAATGVVLTNDGVMATTAAISGEVAAIDFQGAPIALDVIGSDPVYGLMYYRLREGLLTPLDIRADRLPVGWELLLAGRSLESPLPYAATFRVQEFALPPEAGGFGPGVRRLVRGEAAARSTLRGAPLIDTEGRLAAVVINPEAGLALPSEHIRESLQRLTSNTREVNPFAEWGFTPAYRMTAVAGSAAPRFAVEVQGISSTAPARRSGLQAGDLLLSIAGQEVTWDTDVAALLESPQPIALTVQRAEQQLTLPLSALPPSPPPR